MKFSQSSQFRNSLSELDGTLIKEIELEIKGIKNADSTISKIFQKFSNSNESMSLIGITILSLFGLHAILKLLIAVKRGWSFWRYATSLFHSENNSGHPLRSTRDILITATFIFYTFIYFMGNKTWSQESYYFGKKYYTNIEWKWDGSYDYILKDGHENIYNVKRVKPNFYEVLFKNKLIGYYSGDQFGGKFYSLDNKKRAIEFDSQWQDDDQKTHRTNKKFLNVNLQTLLNPTLILPKKEGDYDILRKSIAINIENKHIEEIKSKELDKELSILNNKVKLLNQKKSKIQHNIDSIENGNLNLRSGRYTLNESVAQAKAFLRSKDKDYDTEVGIENNNIRRYGKNSSATKIISTKEMLEAHNNMGYFGTFIKYLYTGTSFYTLQNLYINYILPKSNIINKLRDVNGNIKPLVEFGSFEELSDAVYRLWDWSIINPFILKLPPSVKSLIWQNGWFKKEIQEDSQYLTESFKKISELDLETQKRFFSKISSATTHAKLMDMIQSITKTEPWTYTHWMKKINDTSNAVVTWSSEKDKQIICLVYTYSAIRKLAYMTNWCIYRDSDYFNKYTRNGYQFILYDFNYKDSSNASVIGFTINASNYKVDYCHNKADSSYSLPSKFLDNTGKYYTNKRYINMDYIKVNLKDLFKKFDKNLYTSAKYELRRLLNNDGFVSKFLNFYEGDVE